MTDTALFKKKKKGAILVMQLDVTALGMSVGDELHLGDNKCLKSI